MDKILITRKNILIVLAVLIVVSIGVLVQFYEPEEGKEQAERATVEEKKFVNREGQEWGPLPEGRQEYQVSSAETYPKFVRVVIDPLKVSVGDVQKMHVVLRDTVDIEEVIATIETDNDVVIIPLERVSEKAVTEEDILDQEYFVHEGKLYIASDENRHLALTDEIMSKLLNRAQVTGIFTANAQEEYLKEFTYEGEWTVRDTIVKVYHTVFTVRNSLGEENSITMAWSDPCPGLNHGSNSTISSNCTLISASVDGLDVGNVTIPNGVTLTLNSGSVFVWTPGYSVIINSGGTIITNGSMVQQYLFERDKDGDFYKSPAFWPTYGTSPTPASGYKRAGDILGDDCYDENANVKPDQTTYYSVKRGTVDDEAGYSWDSYDYDCVPGWTKKWTQTGGRCENCSSNGVRKEDDRFFATLIEDALAFGHTGCTPLGVGSTGWVSSAPACGVSDTYYTDPGNCMLDGCPLEAFGCSWVTRAQACR